MAEIIVNNCENAWKKGIEFIMDKGDDHNSKTGNFKQILNFNLEITEPCDDILFPYKRLKESSKWMYPDITELKNVVLAKKNIPCYSFTYGRRLFRFQDCINQINDYVIPLLMEKPDSENAVAVLWDPSVDSNLMKNPAPRLVMCFFKSINGKLMVTSILRNNDMLMGWPATLLQVSILQEYVAQKVEVLKGSLIFYSTMAYINKEHLEDLKYLTNLSYMG